MINVCFDSSVCSAMKCGLGEKSTYVYEGLCYGKINPEYFDGTRKLRIDRIYSFSAPTERDRLFLEEKNCFESLIKQIKRDKEARIWYANNASDRCGLYHLVYRLQEIDCKIYAIEMPSNIGFRNPSWEKGWEEAKPKDFKECLPLTREISIEERNELSEKWEKLIEENADFRTIISGEVASVPADYLDKKIIELLPCDIEFKLGNLIGLALGMIPQYLSCGFIEWRVEELIKQGALIMATDNKDPECRNMKILKRK